MLALQRQSSPQAKRKCVLGKGCYHLSFKLNQVCPKVSSSLSLRLWMDKDSLDVRSKMESVNYSLYRFSHNFAKVISHLGCPTSVAGVWHQLYDSSLCLNSDSVIYKLCDLRQIHSSWASGSSQIRLGKWDNLPLSAVWRTKETEHFYVVTTFKIYSFSNFDICIITSLCYSINI